MRKFPKRTIENLKDSTTTTINKDSTATNNNKDSTTTKNNIHTFYLKSPCMAFKDTVQ